MTRLSRTVILLVVLVVQGCGVGRDYVAPRTATPDQWQEQGKGSLVALTRSIGPWWRGFHDPVLDGLIARGIADNGDVRLASARIRESRWDRQVALSYLGPSIDGTGSYTRAHRSINGQAATFGSGPFAQGNPDYDLYQAGFDASWEIDIVGGVRRGLEAANADVAASQEQSCDVQLTLIAEIARTYVDLREAQVRRSIADAAVDIETRTMELAKARVDAGLDNAIAMGGMETSLDQARARLALHDNEVRQSIHELGVLIGASPKDPLAVLEAPGPLPTLPPIPILVPSELLRQRPDIRASERAVAGATARVGVAEADLYPHVFITGNGGYESGSLSNLVDPASRMWSFGPSFTWHLFDMGRVRANIHVQNVKLDEALISYETTVRRAFAEVEEALAAGSRERIRERALTASCSAAKDSRQLARERFHGGLDTYAIVLDQERALVSARDLRVQSSHDEIIDGIALAKALGGGWQAGEGVALNALPPQAGGTRGTH